MKSDRAVTRVRRLIRQANARPGPGGAVRDFTRGLVWNRIARAGGRWPESERRTAAYRLYRDWCDAGGPDEDAPLTALIVRWSGRLEFDALVMEGAEGRIYNIDAAVCREYCLRHDLLPDAPVDRARFYVLTGRPERWRALDTDGSLIASVDLSDEERDRLEHWLLTQHDWDMLWRLIRGHPPLRLATELREFPVAWRPTAQPDRSLVDALSGADLPSLRAAFDALVDVGVIHLDVPGTVRAGALSDDGRRLAVWTYDTEPSSSDLLWGTWPPGPGTISVFRLPDATLLARHSAAIWHDACLAYAGRELAAFTVRFEEESNEAWLYRCPEDARPLRLAFHDEGDRTRGTVAMAAYEDGYVTVDLNYIVAFHDAAGRRTTTLYYELPNFRDHESEYSGMPAQISVDAASGKIAVMRDWFGVLLDGRRRDENYIPWVSAIEGSRGWRHMALQGEDHMLTSWGRELLVWYLRGSQDRHTLFEGTGRYRKVEHGVVTMIWIPSTGELCCIGGTRPDGNILYLDGKTYEIPAEGRPLTDRKARVLIGSAAGTYYGLGGDGSASVVLLPENTAALALKALADRPLSAWRPEDAHTMQRTMWPVDHEPRFRPLLDLLSACGDYSRATDEAASS